LDHGRVAEAFETSRKALGLEYIDLYLMHWPQAEVPDSERLFGREVHGPFSDSCQNG
jgi:diketogulonate reductase-like aldo/keto reductase